MLLLMLLPALDLEVSLSTLHLHEGLAHTESVSGDFMPARDDCWLPLTSNFSTMQLKVANFEAYHLAHQSLWDSQRLWEWTPAETSLPAPPTGWYCKTNSESIQPCITEFTLPGTRDCHYHQGLLGSLWLLGYCQKRNFKMETDIATRSRLLGIQHLHSKAALTVNKTHT
jgi:hypothetical protein